MILIDTTPLVALCDPRDTLNRVALADLERLARKPLAVVGPVITEACFHLPFAHQRERLRRFLAAFSVVSYISDDESTLWQAVLDWLERYSEHEPDWADGYLAVVSEKEPKSRVWTYDGEFKTTWRRPDGSRIPLAVRR